MIDKEVVKTALGKVAYNAHLWTPQLLPIWTYMDESTIVRLQ